MGFIGKAGSPMLDRHHRGSTIMPEKTVLSAELTWPQFEKRIKGGDTPVMIPLGSHEQHGYHLPLNTDTLLPTAFAVSAAEKAGALVAPTIAYGYKSQQKCGGGQHIPGTLSLDAATLVAHVKDVIKELARNGARRFVMMNGHFENTWFMVEGIDLALRELRWEGIRDAKVVSLSYWDYVDKPTIAKVYPDGYPGPELEHAGVFETSLMLLLHPHLVHMSEVVEQRNASVPPYDVYPIKPEWTPAPGSLSSPKSATKEKGRILFDCCLKGILGSLEAELGKG
jgi:creatinine amidohydrolase